MEPAIKMDAIGMYSKIHIDKYSRKDIVVVDIKEDSYYGDIVVTKRIFGVPGDKIKILGNDIYLNEIVVLKDIKGNPHDIEIQLDSDEFFILGDNHSNSYDSRYIGPIKASQIRGKIILTLPTILKEH